MPRRDAAIIELARDPTFQRLLHDSKKLEELRRTLTPEELRQYSIEEGFRATLRGASDGLIRAVQTGKGTYGPKVRKLGLLPEAADYQGSAMNYAIGGRIPRDRVVAILTDEIERMKKVHKYEVVVLIQSVFGEKFPELSAIKLH